MNPTIEKIGQKVPESRAPAKQFARVFIILLLAVTGVCICTAKFDPAGMDYISYWSAAKLLVQHKNPYSPTNVFSLEKSVGFVLQKPLIMRNPPWALFLAVPLGFAGARAGLILWTLMLAACVVTSVHLLNPKSRNNPLALFFAPVLACLCSGQSSPFLLLGFALFLCFHSRRPYIAGAALLLMAIKPHLFLIFWAVLLVECLHRREFRIIAGCAAAITFASAFAMLFDVRIWHDYLAMMHWANLSNKALPTASMLLRMAINPEAFWLLFVPSALGILWAVWYYLRNREIWDWRVHGMLLMLVAILVSPYSFITDEVVLLPPIIFAISLPQRSRYSGWLLLILNGIALYAVVIDHARLGSKAYLWTPASWLIWFLYTTHRPRSGELTTPPTSAGDEQYA